MKITLNQDPSFPETEVIINCSQADEDILRLVAMLRIHQKKLVGVLNGEQHLLDVKDILYIDTADKRTFLYTGGAVYESALRLYELEDALRELDFLRAGRSAIVNFRRIRSIRPELGGRLLVTMDNDEQVYVSRQYAGEMKEKLRKLERSILQ
ncbi:MAG: LytTR family transcriptional regulator [Oscillibacter sp.]|nr:LytTR family transcriptional regulator [Oscillibacter sp.]